MPRDILNERPKHTVSNVILIICAIILVGGIGFIIKGCFIDKSTSTSPISDNTSTIITITPTHQLELQSWSWHSEYGYAIAEGQVKNISDESLKNVEVVITWYTEDYTFITSDSALIEYNPILPGQTSPFKVYATYNPAMFKAGIDFKFFMGGTISWIKVNSTTDNQ